jgi:hypothetical protein
MYPSLVLAVIGPIAAGLIVACFWDVDWLKADGVLLFVSSPNEGVHLAVCLLPEETKLDTRGGILEAWDRELIGMAASARGTFVGGPWEQVARWSNRQDSRPANLEVANNIELAGGRDIDWG